MNDQCLDSVKADRGLEVLIGIVVAIPAVICVIGAATVIAMAPWKVDTLLPAGILFAVGLWLGRLSIRLLTGRGRHDGGLFGPRAILAGGAILLLGSMGMIVLGALESRWLMVAMGICGVPFGPAAWKLYQSRRIVSET